ncbi:4-galactosyl-N-acetylglucosaminide 3-alpha-L-fucosyltransferase 9-like [Plodia interpunctella]|uniref:4-galactosyl-N-acetylglucosaminide 3-alpha-L-fucosyltransferase 9-like n=1 Tax=Plodia interpunctella TaxID=58824 RepID=UPI002368DEB6|nr:4-galactosyl-N-acetylglucosaminide 3-alpha-L-fucosyltransferase 9-like [Plodia interpunctella]
MAFKKNYWSVIRRTFTKLILRKTLVNGCIIYCLALIGVVIYKYNFSANKKFPFDSDNNEILKVSSLSDHKLFVSEYYEMRKYWQTSKLGSLLFKNETFDLQEQNKTFVILVWKYWKWLKSRHVNFYGPRKDGRSILQECSVKNCVFTGDNSLINSVDAVLVHIMHGIYPKVQNRSINQKWVFLNDESPKYAFSKAAHVQHLKNWSNVFNWSMTYRSNADVPVPYGRTVALDVPVKENVTYESIAELIPNLQYKRSDVLVAVVMSNCHVSHRMKFLEELQKYIKIHIYGLCSPDRKERCKGHFREDCKDINHYYFYLVMENSMCRQYLSEKAFHLAYGKGAIPIILGPSLHDCKTLLPPNSFIHSDDFISYKVLADKIKSIINNVKDYLSYHLWRNHFKVLNEHGYFGSKSYHLCRLCEALNYNDDKRKIYKLDDMRLFLDSNVLCML